MTREVPILPERRIALHSGMRRAFTVDAAAKLYVGKTASNCSGCRAGRCQTEAACFLPDDEPAEPESTRESWGRVIGAALGVATVALLAFKYLF